MSRSRSSFRLKTSTIRWMVVELTALFLSVDVVHAQQVIVEQVVVPAQGAGPPLAPVPRRARAISLALGPLTGAALSPNGKTVISASGDLKTPGVIIAWDLRNGRAKFRLQEKSGVGCVDIGPDGKKVAIGQFDGVVKLLDLDSGKELKTFSAHKAPVYTVAFAPDGKSLASGSLDKTVKVWTLPECKELRTIGPMGEGVLCLAFSANGKTLATGSGDPAKPSTSGKVRLWNLETGKETGSPIVHPGSVSGVAFSENGGTLASASTDGSAILWDLAAGKEKLRIPISAKSLGAVRFSPDNKMLALAALGRGAGALGEVRLWDCIGSRELAAFALPGRVVTVQFSPDGRTLMAASQDQPIKLWEIATRQERASLSVSPQARGRPIPPPQVSQGAVSPGGLNHRITDLVGPDPAGAYRAILSLAEAGNTALPALRERLQPASQALAVSSERIAKLIAQLDDDRSALRENATEELERIGKAAEPALQKALKGVPSAEMNLRIRLILDRLTEARAESQNLMRVVEALEYIATPEARKVLEAAASRPLSDEVKHEIQASLERMSRH